jgi:hypothetical protein
MPYKEASAFCQTPVESTNPSFETARRAKSSIFVVFLPQIH